MITNREVVAAINKLLDTDFDPNVSSKYWNYPNEQFSTYRGRQAKKIADKLLKYFGDLAEEYLSSIGQYEIRIFIDNYAYKIFTADLIDHTTVVIFSIWKNDKTLEEWREEQ